MSTQLDSCPWEIYRRALAITYANRDVVEPASSDTPVGEYRVFDTASDLSAMALMFSRLQKSAFLAYHMIWPYEQWIDRLMNEFITSSESN